MPWKVSANTWGRNGPQFKVVAKTDDDEDPADIMQSLRYWVGNMEPGEKVVIERFPLGDAG